MFTRWRPMLVLASLWLSANPALAWTETRVETVHARVDLDAEANADIELDIFVYVRAGWLEGFEIAGLDPELTVDENPVEVRSVPRADEHGRKPPSRRFSPTVRLHDDRVSLRFRRRVAPRRGHYRIRLRYRTNLADRTELNEDGERFRIHWTLPGWQSGLDGVLVELRGPEGSDFAPDRDDLTVVTRNRSHEGGRSVLRWRRAHLPRTVPWTVAIEVPRTRMAPLLAAREDASRSAPEPTTPAEAPAPTWRSLGHGPVAGALLIGLHALLALVLFDREAQRRRAVPRPWLPLPTTIRAGVLLAATGIAAACAHWAAWTGCFGAACVAIVAAAQRRAHRQVPGLGRWRPVRREDLEVAARRCRRTPWALVRWADVTTAPGALTLLLATLTLAAVHAADVSAGRDASMTPWLWALLPLPLMAATRQRLPRTPEARLQATAQLARRLRSADGYAPAIALALHEAADGRWQDARIRLVTETRPAGLLRLDIALDDEDVAHGILLTREKTEADAQAAKLTTALPIRGPGGRIARVVPLDEALPLALRFRPRTPKRRKRRTTVQRNRHRLRPAAAPLH